ncbi:MAG TPA: RidA family protein [Candidatus Polarisedimenticolaceae bacterium]
MSDYVSSRAPEPVGAFPHAKRVGDFLFLSGIGPRTPGTNAIPTTFEEQALAVFRNVRTVLEDAGASWEDIVDVTVFLTNMKRDFPSFNRLYAEHFATNRPTRTTVEVGALPTPIDVELKVVAYLKK